MKNSKYFLGLLLLSVLSAGCQRSPFFRREDESTPDSSANGIGSAYYGRSPDSSDRSENTSPKKRVVILDFWNDTPAKQSNYGGYAADELKRALGITQRVILMPQEIRSGMATEDFIQGDKVRVAQLLREGRRLGVAVVVIGKVTKIFFRQKGDEVGLLRQKKSTAIVEIEAKLFDVQGGREIMAVTRGGEASSSNIIALDDSGIESSPFRIELVQTALRGATNELVMDVLRSLEKINWQGRIAKTMGPKIYISAGRASGLISGDILKVTNPGEDVYDPSTNAFLGRSQGKLKGTLEVVDFLGPDGAVAEIHTGGNFREGDLVELY